MPPASHLDLTLCGGLLTIITGLGLGERRELRVLEPGADSFSKKPTRVKALVCLPNHFLERKIDQEQEPSSLAIWRCYVLRAILVMVMGGEG